jgi:heme A synthase
MVKRLLDRGILDVIGHRAFGVVVVLVIVVFLALAWMDRGLDRSVSRAEG